MKKSLAEVRLALQVLKAQRLFAEETMARTVQEREELIARNLLTDAVQHPANRDINREYTNGLTSLLSQLNLEQYTETEFNQLLQSFEPIYNDKNDSPYKKKCQEIKDYFYTRELNMPWEQCKPWLYHDKLKMELTKEGSIAKRIGAPYTKLMAQLDRLKNNMYVYDDTWGEEYKSEGYDEYRKAYDTAIQLTIDLLFKEKLSVEEYKNCAQKLEMHGSPTLRALGCAMMVLGVAILTLCLLTPAAPAVIAVAITGSIASGLAGFGLFKAGAPNEYAVKACEGLPECLSDVANTLSSARMA